MSQTEPIAPDAVAEGDEEQATTTFSTSILISAVRCTLTYVVFPWLLPLLHLGDAVGPVIGVIISPVAIYFNYASIRRMWAADHRWKWPVSVLNAGIIGLVSALFVIDLIDLLG